MSGIKILVVDDTVALAMEIRTQLQRWGHTVEVMHDGEGVLERLQGSSFDLLITDNNMGKVGGLEVIYSLRTKEAFKNLSTKIILMSGYDLSNEAREYNAEFLLKPFRIPELKELLKKMF